MQLRFILLLLLTSCIVACNKDDDNSDSGCTDPNACNYSASASEDDGTCQYSGDSCNDGDPSTINDIWNDDCDCIGENPDTDYMEATINGELVRAEYPCPEIFTNAECNHIENNGIWLKMAVSAEETGWYVELFLNENQVSSLTFPHTIEIQDSSPNDVLNYKYYAGSWSGSNLYEYVNTPVAEGEIIFTITSLEDNVIEGTFVGELPRASNPNDTAIFENGSFKIHLNQ